MSNYVVGRDDSDPRGKTFGLATVITLVIGVMVALVVIYRFRSPAPVVIEHPPEIHVIEKFSPAPTPPPTPPPVVQEPPPPAPAPPPPPPPVLKAQPSFGWGGLWRREKYPLPMFRFAESAGAVSGTYAANWGTVLAFRNGVATSNSLEFAVDDGVFLVRFRLVRDTTDAAVLYAWITDHDWADSLVRANKAARTRQQAVVARVIMEQNAQLRVPKKVGVFFRSPQ